MKIVVDAMGSDESPKSEVLAVLRGLNEMTDVEFILVGDQTLMQQYLPEQLPSRLTIVHTDEKITGEDDAALAVRQKPNASMSLALKMVKNKEADAIVSAGNTGAYLSGAVLSIGRLKGIMRPALASILPTPDGRQSVILDLGANSETTDMMLFQNGIIGSIIASEFLQVKHPKVGLLNNGTEYKKGTPAHKEAYQLLQQDGAIDFVGNIEGRDFATGVVDVLVADGFSGNIALKTFEGTLRYVAKLLKYELTKTTWRKIQAGIGLLIIGPLLKKIAKQYSDEAVGGAILAGVKAPVIKAHGNSNSDAYFGALVVARQFVEAEITAKIEKRVIDGTK
ncbi:MAG: phosphate acyltransferase PlsX [Culicoidibacterales bacterium]